MPAIGAAKTAVPWKVTVPLIVVACAVATDAKTSSEARKILWDEWFMCALLPPTDTAVSHQDWLLTMGLRGSPRTGEVQEVRSRRKYPRGAASRGPPPLRSRSRAGWFPSG